MIKTIFRRFLSLKQSNIQCLSKTRTFQAQYLFTNSKILDQNEKIIKIMENSQKTNKIQDKKSEEVSQLDKLSDQLKKIEVSNQSVQTILLKPHDQNQVQNKFQLRVFKTYFTITFLPTKQVLQSIFKNQYNFQQDNLLTIYKFTCKKCKHKSMRSFPQNGYKYGTVITGCNNCHQILLVSDNLGWVQPEQVMNFVNTYGIAIKDMLQITRKVKNYLFQLKLKNKSNFSLS